MSIPETLLQIILFPLVFAAVILGAGTLALAVGMAAVIAYEEIRERLGDK